MPTNKKNLREKPTAPRFLASTFVCFALGLHRHPWQTDHSARTGAGSLAHGPCLRISRIAAESMARCSGNKSKTNPDLCRHRRHCRPALADFLWRY